MDESVEGLGHPPATPFTLAIAEVLALIVQALGCTEIEAQTWLQYLVNDGGLLTELYSHPVIPMADDAIALFVPGLLHAEFGRVVDHDFKPLKENRAIGLTIAEAKAGLAISFDVPESAIEIVIRA